MKQQLVTNFRKLFPFKQLWNKNAYSKRIQNLSSVNYIDRATSWAKINGFEYAKKIDSYDNDFKGRFETENMLCREQKKTHEEKAKIVFGLTGVIVAVGSVVVEGIAANTCLMQLLFTITILALLIGLVLLIIVLAELNTYASVLEVDDLDSDFPGIPDSGKINGQQVRILYWEYNHILNSMRAIAVSSAYRWFGLGVAMLVISLILYIWTPVSAKQEIQTKIDSIALSLSKTDSIVNKNSTILDLRIMNVESQIDTMFYKNTNSIENAFNMINRINIKCASKCKDKQVDCIEK